MQTQTIVPENNLFLFYEIYHLAKSKNKEALDQLIERENKKINDEICLGFFQGAKNIIMQLARERNIDTVNFLINEFNLSYDDAVAGYAWGGHVDLVEKLLDQGASPLYAIKGYAQGCHVDQVNEMISGEVSHNYAVLGYALGGYVEQVQQLLQKGADINFAVRGYAQGGYVGAVNKLIALGANPKEALKGYAKGGHVPEVKQLISQHQLNDVAIDEIKGYARGGHVNQVKPRMKTLIDNIRGLDDREYYDTCYRYQSHLISSYAEGGHNKRVDKLIKIDERPSNYENGLVEYARVGNIHQVNYLWNQCTQKFTSRSIDFSKVYDAYASNNLNYLNEGYLLRLLTFIESPIKKYILGRKEQIELRNATPDESKIIENKYQSLNLKATQLNYIIKTFHVGFTEAPSLTIRNAIFWLLIGEKSANLNKDIFWLVTQYLLGLPLKDAQNVCNAVQNYFSQEIKGIKIETPWWNKDLLFSRNRPVEIQRDIIFKSSPETVLMLEPIPVKNRVDDDAINYYSSRISFDIGTLAIKLLSLKYKKPLTINNQSAEIKITSDTQEEKVVLTITTSGYIIEDETNKEIYWHNVDKEISAKDQLGCVVEFTKEGIKLVKFITTGEFTSLMITFLNVAKNDSRKKERILEFIFNHSDIKQKQKWLEQANNPNHPLGNCFREPRGLFKVYEHSNKTLNKIRIELRSVDQKCNFDIGKKIYDRLLKNFILCDVTKKYPSTPDNKNHVLQYILTLPSHEKTEALTNILNRHHLLGAFFRDGYEKLTEEETMLQTVYDHLKANENIFVKRPYPK